MPPPPSRRPGVFFDRDGIVNESPGPGYVNHLDDFHLRAGFLECVRVVTEKGLPAIVVTNQRGISRGITPPEQLAAMHAALRTTLARDGLALLDILICTADDPAHPDRKPNPGMLLTAAQRHDIDLAQSWIIGDRESDVQTGQHAGVAVTVLVDPALPNTAATHQVPDMLACAALLRRELKRAGSK